MFIDYRRIAMILKYVKTKYFNVIKTNSRIKLQVLQTYYYLIL